MAPRNKAFKLGGKVYLLDASLVELTLSLFPWAKYQKTKGAAKLHVGLDADGYLPAFVDLTEGREHEIRYARDLDLPKGSYVVFDRGYTDYSWYQELTNEGVFFVTRLKSNSIVTSGRKRRGRKSPGVVEDREIRLGKLPGRCRNRHHVSVRNQCPGHPGSDGRRLIQGALADRALLQVDQAELEGKGLSGHLAERREDSALDCVMRLPGPVVPEVPVENRRIVAAYVANITAQPV